MLTNAVIFHTSLDMTTVPRQLQLLLGKLAASGQLAEDVRLTCHYGWFSTPPLGRRVEVMDQGLGV